MADWEFIDKMKKKTLESIFRWIFLLQLLSDWFDWGKMVTVKWTKIKKKELNQI